MTTYTYIHSFMTLSQRFDPYHDTCVTRLVITTSVETPCTVGPCCPSTGVPVWTGGNSSSSRAREHEKDAPTCWWLPVS